MKGPLVSICIPTYNMERYIKETIEDCLGQTHQNLEIIISDNCSTDKTLDIIRSFNDPRIKIFLNEKNEGLIYNFKQVFTYATGKYMTFLSADDGMTLDTVEKAVAVLEAPGNENVTLVNTYIRVIDDSGKLILVKKFVPLSGRISGYWGIRLILLYGTSALGEPNGSLFRKDAYDKIPEPKLHHGSNWTADIDLKNELMLQGDTWIIPEPLGKYRISKSSYGRNELQFKHAKLFRSYALKIYKDPRYKLSFFWVITATVNSFLLEIARNIFYLIFSRSKKSIQQDKNKE